MVRFNPSLTTYKNIIGAVPKDKNFDIAIKFENNLCVDRVFLCFFKDGQETVYKRFLPLKKSDKKYGLYKTKINFPIAGLYFYYFEVETKDGLKFVGQGKNLQGQLGLELKQPYQLTVYKKNDSANWFKGGLVYHIFVDRFFKGSQHGYPQNAIVNQNWFATPDHRPVKGEILNNEFFGGDIEGITQKLDYIKSLGASVIYLSPILKANSNHKYNTGDFLQIDEGFGNEHIFETFVNKAKQKGIDVILDGVFSHVGDDSIYFNKYNNYDSLGAFQSKDSPYYEWFTFENFPNKYKTWWGIKTLPEINKTSQSYCDFICNNVVPKWFDWGIKGVRLDVVDELPDCFLYPLCDAVKRQGDNIVIGEVWENATDKIAYGKRRKYFQGEQLDSVMNYPLKDGIIKMLNDGDGQSFVNCLLQQINNYPKDSLDKLFNLLSSHDTVRIVTALGNQHFETKDQQATACLCGQQLQIAKQKLKLAAVLQYTLYGVPCLFYGDEAGLQGYGDPFCRKCYPWGREDKDLIEFYIQLGKLRKDSLFVDSNVKNIKFKDSILSFDRKNKKDCLSVYVNITQDNKKIRLKKGFVTVFGSGKNLPAFGFTVAKSTQNCN